MKVVSFKIIDATTVGKIQRRYEALTGLKTPTIQTYRNNVLHGVFTGASNPNNVVGVLLKIQPYSDSGSHSIHAISAVKYKKTLFCFNAWGIISLPKDRDFFNTVKENLKCKNIIVYIKSL